MSNIGINIWTTGPALEQPELLAGAITNDVRNTTVQIPVQLFSGDSAGGHVDVVVAPTLDAGEYNSGGVDASRPMLLSGGDAENGVFGTFPPFRLFAGSEAPPIEAGVQAIASPTATIYGYTWNIGGVDTETGTLSRIGDLPGAVMEGEFPPFTLSALLFDGAFGIGTIELPLFGVENGFVLAQDTLNLSSSVDSELVVLIREALALNATEDTTGSYQLVTGSDTLLVRAILNVPYMVQLVDQLGLAGTQEVTAEKLITLIDTLGLTALEDTEASTLTVTLAAALALNSASTTALNLTLSDALGLIGENSNLLRQNADLIDALALTAVDNTALFATDDVLDTLGLDDTASTGAVLQVLVEEGMGFFVSVRVGEDVIHGWVVNTELQAFSEYENFPFNSLVSANGRYFGVAADGLYELTGDTDEGSDIAASFRTGLTDLGTHSLKNIKAAYIGYTADDKLVLKVSTTAKGQKEEWWYELKQSDAASLRDGRFRVWQGLRAKYWQFEVANTNGADFEVDDLQFMYQILSRRIR